MFSRISLYVGKRSSQPSGVIMPRSRKSSACCFTWLWTKSVAFCGSTPAAMQSTNMSRSAALMTAVSW